MTIKDLVDKNIFKVLNTGDFLETEIKAPLCCDLLSLAIGKSQEGLIWFTVMGNINTIAVASLSGIFCIVISEGFNMDMEALEKAKEVGITVMWTEEPEFESAMKVMEYIKCSN